MTWLSMRTSCDALLTPPAVVPPRVEARIAPTAPSSCTRASPSWSVRRATRSCTASSQRRWAVTAARSRDVESSPPAKHGQSHAEVLSQMKEMRSDDAHEQEERTWSLVYNASEDIGPLRPPGLPEGGALLRREGRQRLPPPRLPGASAITSREVVVRPQPNTSSVLRYSPRSVGAHEPFFLDERGQGRHGEAWRGYRRDAHVAAARGVQCHTCGATWSDVGHDYPSVDLSLIPGHHEFEKPRPEPFPEFARLRSGFALWCHATPSCHLERPSAH